MATMIVATVRAAAFGGRGVGRDSRMLMSGIGCTAKLRRRTRADDDRMIEHPDVRVP